MDDPYDAAVLDTKETPEMLRSQWRDLDRRRQLSTQIARQTNELDDTLKHSLRRPSLYPPDSYRKLARMRIHPLVVLRLKIRLGQ